MFGATTISARAPAVENTRENEKKSKVEVVEEREREAVLYGFARRNETEFMFHQDRGTYSSFEPATQRISRKTDVRIDPLRFVLRADTSNVPRFFARNRYLSRPTSVKIDMETVTGEINYYIFL